LVSPQPRPTVMNRPANTASTINFFTVLPSFQREETTRSPGPQILRAGADHTSAPGDAPVPFRALYRTSPDDPDAVCRRPGRTGYFLVSFFSVAFLVS
jgi:hypothetical protein